MKIKKSLSNLAMLLIITLIIGMMPAIPSTVYADPAEPPEVIRVSICADLHLKGQGEQNNRQRFETYLKGIRDFGPEMIILCGDQFEGAYEPPIDGEYTSEAGIGREFKDPYTEINEMIKSYLPYAQIIFTTGNNDYTDLNFPTYQAITNNLYRNDVIVTKNFDVFTFGAPDEGTSDPAYSYSEAQITALDNYLASRPDKTKLVLVAGHYPIDDMNNTPTNNKVTLRNAGNAEAAKAVLADYDQPIVFLWGHNHDLGPVAKEHIIRKYHTGYTTLNAGAVGYKGTTDYAQGVNLTLNTSNSKVEYAVQRYPLVGEPFEICSGDQLIMDGQIWSTGDGTAGNPYQISEAGHLIYLSVAVNEGEDYANKYFVQMNDINLDGINWETIGRYASSSGDYNRGFAGTYDGNGHIISNLNIDETLIGAEAANKGYGLFGHLIGTIKNLGLTNAKTSVKFTGYYNAYAGGLAGYVGYLSQDSGYIFNSFVNGNVMAATTSSSENPTRCAAGGLAGYFRNGEISKCYSEATAVRIDGSVFSGAGGLVGFKEIYRDDDIQSYLSESYVNEDLTDNFGFSNSIEGITVAALTTGAMKLSSFVDQLNENAGTSYTSWMSDEYTGLNSGYPIHVRLVEPIITTTPASVTSVANDSSVEVSLTTPTPGAETYYTTDGRVPTSESEPYVNSFSLTTSNTEGETKTIKAVSVLEGESSSVTSKAITFAKAPSPASSGGGGGSFMTATPLEIQNSSLSDATIGVLYNEKLLAKGGEGTYQWSASGLPKGLSLTTDGAIKGTPVEFGKFTIDLKVTDKNDKSVSKKLALQVNLATSTGPVLKDIQGHWAEAGIQRAINQGFIKGYMDQTFKPDNQITRAEFITMLVKALNLETKGQTAWTDINSHWAKESIQIAAHHGIAKGFSNTSFSPNETLTRQELSALLIRALDLNLVTGKTEFKDSDEISGWAEKSISMAIERNLMAGYPDNTFRSKNTATRAEAITVILNALDSIALQREVAVNGQ